MHGLCNLFLLQKELVEQEYRQVNQCYWHTVTVNRLGTVELSIVDVLTKLTELRSASLLCVSSILDANHTAASTVELSIIELG